MVSNVNLKNYRYIIIIVLMSSLLLNSSCYNVVSSSSSSFATVSSQKQSTSTSTNPTTTNSTINEQKLQESIEIDRIFATINKIDGIWTKEYDYTNKGAVFLLANGNHLHFATEVITISRGKITARINQLSSDPRNNYQPSSSSIIYNEFKILLDDDKNLYANVVEVTDSKIKKNAKIIIDISNIDMSTMKGTLILHNPTRGEYWNGEYKSSAK